MGKIRERLKTWGCTKKPNTSVENLHNPRHRRYADLNQQVRVEHHQISCHLSRNFDPLCLQLCVHTEKYIMGVTVVPCRRNIKDHFVSFSEFWDTQAVILFYSVFCVCQRALVPALWSSLAMMMAVRAASLYCWSAMYSRNRYLASWDQ